MFKKTSTQTQKKTKTNIKKPKRNFRPKILKNCWQHKKQKIGKVGIEPTTHKELGLQPSALNHSATSLYNPLKKIKIKTKFLKKPRRIYLVFHPKKQKI